MSYQCPEAHTLVKLMIEWGLALIFGEGRGLDSLFNSVDIIAVIIQGLENVYNTTPTTVL